MNCGEIDDLLPAVALGMATRDEQRQVEEHLRSCDKHPHAAELQQVAESLPMSLSPRKPRDQVKHQLMARVYRDLDAAPSQAWWQRPWGWAVAAVLAIVALGLGARDYVVSNQLASAPMQWQLHPAVSGSDVSGTLVYVPQQGVATLTLQQLPQLAPNRVYEVWLIKNGAAQPAGVLKPSPEGVASIIVKGRPLAYDTVAVTEEPGPDGSPAPTDQPFIVGALK